MLSFVVLSCLAASAFGSALPVEDRIVGGTSTSNSTLFPYIVQILGANNGRCGGSILNKHWVATAATCTDGRTIGDLTVLAGSAEWGSGMNYSVTRIEQNEFFTPEDNHNNIALLRVAPFFEFTEEINTINTIFNPPRAGNIGLIAGWGETQPKRAFSDTLNYAEVEIITLNECRDVYGNIALENICAGLFDGGVDGCVGDIGGPMVVDDLLAGIISVSLGCARPQIPRLYTNVALMGNWMGEIMQQDTVQS